MEKRILLFYKFVNIDNPEEFADEHMTFCKSLGVLGKVLVGKEGVNGSISGDKEQVEAYKKHMWSDSRFSDIVFKEDIGLQHPFKKMIVRVRGEIIALGVEINLENKGDYISPEEFLSLYEKGEKVIVLDARNNYESKVGKFRNAITPDIKTFREFPKVVEMLKDKKDAKIVTYCTGGIRCEKASAYLKERGFKNVRQLEGGIITFGKKFPDTVWEGSCFVFDKRLVVPINTDGKKLTECESCKSSCDHYRNCKNTACDRYVILCPSCDKQLNGCCSQDCQSVFKERHFAKALANMPMEGMGY